MIAACGMKPARHAGQVGAREDELEQEGERDRRDQRDHHDLEAAESVDAADRAPAARRATVITTPIGSGMRNSRLSAIADPITSARSQAAIAISAKHPEGNAGAAASSGRDRPARGRDRWRCRASHGERLQQHRHQVGDEDDAEQRVAEPRAAGEVGGPVARVHVADGDEIARAGERQRLPPTRALHGDGAVRLGERRRETRAPPPAPRRGRGGRRNGRPAAIRRGLLRGLRRGYRRPD